MSAKDSFFVVVFETYQSNKVNTNIKKIKHKTKHTNKRYENHHNLRKIFPFFWFLNFSVTFWCFFYCFVPSFPVLIDIWESTENKYYIYNLYMKPHVISKLNSNSLQDNKKKRICLIKNCSCIFLLLVFVSTFHSHENFSVLLFILCSILFRIGKNIYKTKIKFSKGAWIVFVTKRNEGTPR